MHPHLYHPLQVMERILCWKTLPLALLDEFSSIPALMRAQTRITPPQRSFLPPHPAIDCGETETPPPGSQGGTQPLEPHRLEHHRQSINQSMGGNCTSMETQRKVHKTVHARKCTQTNTCKTEHTKQSIQAPKHAISRNSDQSSTPKTAREQ